MPRNTSNDPALQRRIDLNTAIRVVREQFGADCPGWDGECISCWAGRIVALLQDELDDPF